MLEARKVGLLSSKYELTSDGAPLTVWDGSLWRSGGSFTLGSVHYEVRTNIWGNRYDLTDGFGSHVAVAEKVGRKNWTVAADGRVYEFQRANLFGTEQALLADGQKVGAVRRVSAWRSDVEADLPGLSPPVQVFVIGVVVTMWDNQASSGG